MRTLALSYIEKETKIGYIVCLFKFLRKKYIKVIPAVKEIDQECDLEIFNQSLTNAAIEYFSIQQIHYTYVLITSISPLGIHNNSTRDRVPEEGNYYAHNKVGNLVFISYIQT